MYTRHAQAKRPDCALQSDADQLGWAETCDAEYLALTQLQADAFITLDGHLARPVEDLVKVAPIEALS